MSKAMGRYYDRDGQPLVDVFEWTRLLGDVEYKRIAFDELDDGRYISTVWLGLDHGFGRGPPLIFETMTFDPGHCESDCRRYATLEEARAGHAEMLAELRSKPCEPR